jgi:hypothetical protein
MTYGRPQGTQGIASAGGNELFGGEKAEASAMEDTSMEECASDENSLQPANFLLSHRSILLNSWRSRRFDSLSIIVSNYFNSVSTC